MLNQTTVPYEVVRLISRGGMGCVYEGRANLPSGDSHPVAIKVIRREEADKEDARRHFAIEARTSLALNHNHPNLVTTYAFHTTGDGRPYMVMEYVDGVSADALVRGDMGDDAQFFAVVRRIARGVLSALMHLHLHGVIHRDVSPGNILLGRNGAVKLADMGICKALEAERSRGFAGTTPYACPEALRGAKHTVRFDLFSLACVLYELLTGAPPFGTGEPDDVYFRMAESDTDPSLPDDVPGDLATLVTRLLTVNAEDARFHSAKECLAFLQSSGEQTADDALMSAVVSGLAARSTVPTDIKTVTRPMLFPPRRRPMLRWALLGSAAAALMMSLGLNGYLLSQRSPEKTRIAEHATVSPAQSEPDISLLPLEPVTVLPVVAENERTDTAVKQTPQDKTHEMQQEAIKGDVRETAPDRRMAAHTSRVRCARTWR